jgi:two-component system, NtrC family, nitrogen regulation sensor histidine kinase NtrY
MRKRVLIGSGVAVLAILASLLVWQGSFNFGDYGPTSPGETFLFWAISTLIFLLTVTLGFMLFRTGVKLYMEWQSNRAGSRIRSKLIVGALMLSFVPVIFLIAFEYFVLNRNLEKWFNRPAEHVRTDLLTAESSFKSEFQAKVRAQAEYIALLPQTTAALTIPDTAFFSKLCAERDIARLLLTNPAGGTVELCAPSDNAPKTKETTIRTPVVGTDATLALTSRLPQDFAALQAEINQHVRDYDQLASSKGRIFNLYLLYMILIAAFVLFLATWIARILADQISNPISALLHAAGEVRRGNLSARVRVKAIDELATLVRGFNEMIQELEANSRELENRRQFTEAILESIPTGVISLTADGKIQRINRALRGIFPEEQVARATHLRDLFCPEDAAEIRYLMKRARRTGLAASQFDYAAPDKMMHLAVTVSAIAQRGSSGFVIVLEDTSELLRAQKTAAWQEVARRIAHELKNPLTPIALSAERISRQIDRVTSSGDAQRILHECSATIAREVESVKTLVDEFSQFARFPTAQPVRCDLNDIVQNAMEVFGDRLLGIQIRMVLADSLPAVSVDPEQFKRVVINLVDNAAEAMHDSLVRNLLIATQSMTDSVELTIADTGCGITPEDKEKLFLPYFSTKRRGTGLGLAIVARIVADHNATIRVEENKPAGARFMVEIPALAAIEAAENEARAAETPA